MIGWKAGVQRLGTPSGIHGMMTCGRVLLNSKSPQSPPYRLTALLCLQRFCCLWYTNTSQGTSTGVAHGAFSRSSLDFRDVYVAIVLFLGAYVWIKFREAAPAGVHRRKLRGTKVVYDARLTPPTWNGRKVPMLELGRLATPQEAHNKFLIAAFYYNRRSSAECILDGWFPVPPMSEEERSLTGLELRAWVVGQAKKVYEDFQKKKAEATLLLQELLEACEDQVTQEQDDINVDFPMVSLLSVAEHRQPAFVSEVENSRIGVATISDNHGLECASHSFDGMHEGLALPIGYSLGSQEGSALPVSQLPPNTESGMNMNGSDQLNLLQTLVSTLQQQISDQQQQISDQQQNIREFGAQILLLQRQQRIQQQQLQEYRIQNPQSPCQFCLQQQQLQVINQGFPSSEVEMEEQSMHQHNYPELMTPPPDGGKSRKASQSWIHLCTCRVVGCRSNFMVTHKQNIVLYTSYMSGKGYVKKYQVFCFVFT